MISVINGVKHNIRKKQHMNFAFYEISDFEKKTISSRMMTSRQGGSSENVANFVNLENQEFCNSKFPQ